MVGRIPTRAARFAAALFAAGALLAVAAGAAGAMTLTTIYSNIPSPLPGNVPSEAFEATSTSEFGGQIELGSANLANTRVTVAMSSWACGNGGGAEDGTCLTTAGAKFEWPVTLHIYTVGPGNTVGTQVGLLTRTFKMPYRPSANPTKCAGNGGWSSKGICYHGKLFKISFSLKGVAIPAQAIVSVSYNTSDFGAEPQRSIKPAGGPYDSLNVGAMEGPPTAGHDPVGESAYVNSKWSGAYCDAVASEVFRYDPTQIGGCVSGYDGIVGSGLQPGIEVATG